MDKPFVLCCIYNCFCHGVWKMFFQAGADSQQFVWCLIAEWYDIYDCRLCFCQCSCLVKYDGVCFCHCFQIFSTFDCDVVAACLADCRQYGNRHGQFQCARKIYHQYSQCFCYISCKKIGKTCSCQCVWNEFIRQMFCLAFQSGFEFLGFFDHRHDLLKFT